MKEITVTRKVKQALSAHFDKGGNVDNVKGELARVPMDARRKCYDFWKARKEP